MRSDFYVYALFREDGRPFYIGKGNGPRWTDHERKQARYNPYKDAVIQRLLTTIGEVPKVKLHQHLTNDQAIAYEIALIAAIGRAPNGPLANLTAGGDGLVDPSPATRAKMREIASNRPPEHLEKISRAKTNPSLEIRINKREGYFKMSPEKRANCTKAFRNKSPEHLAKLLEVGRSNKTRAKRRASNIAAYRNMPPERRAKCAHRGVKRSTEFCVKMREIALKREAKRRAAKAAP